MIVISITPRHRMRAIVQPDAADEKLVQGRLAEHRDPSRAPTIGFESPTVDG